MRDRPADCPCCDDSSPHDAAVPSRREFLQTGGALAAAVAGGVLAIPVRAAESVNDKSAENFVKLLYESLSPKQRETVCFGWDHVDPKRGLLRTHISNNWRITPPSIQGDYFTADQQALIRGAFERIVNPDWVERFDRQFQDDMGGFGKRQSIAIFGEPGGDAFEFVLTGRHGTVRCDGNTTDHVAFGGPIVYGHAASGYHEKPDHPGNVFWHQAKAANHVFEMLDGKQRKEALLPEAPDESEIAFRGAKGKEAKYDGIPVAALSADQQSHVQVVLEKLIEPYRQSDRDEVVSALRTQGGLEKCHLAFYQRDDLGDDGVWDNWRLEGPAFVWHYRGAPHVHVWVNVADDPTVATNSKNLSGPLRKEKKED